MELEYVEEGRGLEKPDISRDNLRNGKYILTVSEIGKVDSLTRRRVIYT